MDVRIGMKSVGSQGWKSLWQGQLVTRTPGGGYEVEPVGEISLDPEEARSSAEAEREKRRTTDLPLAA